MFSQGILFANFSCLCSLRYAFQPHSKLCVPSGYAISRFLIVFYVLSGSGSGSQVAHQVIPPPCYFLYLFISVVTSIVHINTDMQTYKFIFSAQKLG